MDEKAPTIFESSGSGSGSTTSKTEERDAAISETETETHVVSTAKLVFILGGLWVSAYLLPPRNSDCLLINVD